MLLFSSIVVSRIVQLASVQQTERKTLSKGYGVPPLPTSTPVSYTGRGSRENTVLTSSLQRLALFGSLGGWQGFQAGGLWIILQILSCYQQAAVEISVADLWRHVRCERCQIQKTGSVMLDESPEWYNAASKRPGNNTANSALLYLIPNDIYDHIMIWVPSCKDKHLT